ncbi:MAG TPA: FixH family protein [Blastocatellia bacterium]|nr:FixH family protein [Blastocatellia bacterium]
MKIRTVLISFAIAISFVILGACGGAGSSGAEKIIKSTKSGDTTIALSSPSGEIKSGENDLTLSFTGSSGNPVDVPAASLKFYMPAMGSMAEMNDVATLTTTGTPGTFKVRVNIEVAGSWEAMISFQGSRGTEQATMSVTAK